MRLSVFSTLKATLFLWAQNFWYLVALTLVIETPCVVLMHFSKVPAHSSHPGLFFALGLSGLLFAFLLEAAHSAAVLGLLRSDHSKSSMFAAIWSCVRNYTWTLFRLTLLIGLYALLLAAPVGLIIKIFGTSKFVVLFLTGFFFMLLKYALADPLVVVENLDARAALSKSWELTKGHFWYVLGCYCFLWLCEWAVNQAVLPILSNNDAQWSFSVLFTRLALELVDTLWLVLSWCMYLRIKETAVPPFSESVTAIQSSPESPSASQSA